MLKKALFRGAVIIGPAVLLVCMQTASRTGTVVSIRGEKFFINGAPTYSGRTWKGMPVEGLLFNARMVNGIFDDLNPETAARWSYPDTGKWDPDRNTTEFVAAMPSWHAHGLLAFTINMQGGSPMGYGNLNWINSGYTEDGRLRPAYRMRMEKILQKADELGMVVILGLFYFGQDQHLKDEEAVITAVDNTLDWLFATGHRNIMIEVNNECDIDAYDHDILRPHRVHELIDRIRTTKHEGRSFPVGTSYKGNTLPASGVIRASDFVLLHGNAVDDPARITEMVDSVRLMDGYTPKPVLFNEDDHYDFDKPVNNFTAAVRSYASWGFFDYRRRGESFEEGYQSVPADWQIRSERKKGFFNLLGEITGK